VRALPSDDRHWSAVLTAAASDMLRGAYNLSTRTKVQFIETVIREHPLALTAADFPLVHHLAPGLYARELHVPKGMLIIGKIHKHPCISILSKGDLSVLIGEDIVRVKAPYASVSPAGIKRIAYIHDDIVWTTVHATTETDIEKLEHDLVAETEQEYEEFCRIAADEARKCLS
jgi:hypothetical protein